MRDRVRRRGVDPDRGGVLTMLGSSCSPCCAGGDGWYCYCPTLQLINVTISQYTSDYYYFPTTQVNGTYSLPALACYGSWVHQSIKGSCEANSGAINGIYLSVSLTGLFIRAGDSAGGTWCTGWRTDTFASAISVAGGASIYDSVCSGNLPISGTALGRANGVTYFSFLWSIGAG